MKPLIFITLICLLPELLLAQTKLSGTINDPKGIPLPGVNVFIKDTYDGATTDIFGKFNFNTDETGKHILVMSMIGFENMEKEIELNGTEISINTKLKEKANELNTVTVTAGSFDASDDRKMVMLRPLDIVTTAGAAGDIYGALQTLPGTQLTGEAEGLFVRGGDANESKTFIDGILVNNPYFTSVPDVPQRGRFSPFLFKGTSFSTGGYSAQYGHALSSALILESQDLPAKTTTNIGVMSVGGNIGHSHRFKNTSIGVYGGYINLWPYYQLVKQDRNWSSPPESYNGSLIFRQKTSSSGMLKVFTSIEGSNLSLSYTDLNDPKEATRIGYKLRNTNLFTNVSYKELLSKNWTIFTSGSISANHDNAMVDSNAIENQNNLYQGRLTLTHSLGELSTIRFGGEYLSGEIESQYNMFKNKFRDNSVAGYAEGDIYITHKLVSRVGIRAEHSDAIDEFNIAPRISIAYKTGKFTQCSFAYGDFYQNPDYKYVRAENDLSFEKATHYILNFQHVDDKRTFRIETYYKQYHNLLRTVPNTTTIGDGYAKGIDIFWRDKKTIKYADYWISYSFVDTKRQYLDYPVKATPTFVAQHTVSVVFKYWFMKARTSVGFTYLFATGRPYFNPNATSFLSDHTKAVHNLSLTASKLTMIGKHFTVLVASIGNVPGVKNVFTYNYSDDGMRREAVGPPSLRTFFVGCFISIGEDRTDD